MPVPDHLRLTAAIPCEIESTACSAPKPPQAVCDDTELLKAALKVLAGRETDTPPSSWAEALMKVASCFGYSPLPTDLINRLRMQGASK